MTTVISQRKLRLNAMPKPKARGWIHAATAPPAAPGRGAARSMASSQSMAPMVETCRHEKQGRSSGCFRPSTRRRRSYPSKHD